MTWYTAFAVVIMLKAQSGNSSDIHKSLTMSAILFVVLLKLFFMLLQPICAVVVLLFFAAAGCLDPSTTGPLDCYLCTVCEYYLLE